MKKLILLLSIVFAGFVAMAQSTPTEVSPDAYLYNATYDYVWGTTADTVTDASSVEFVFRVKGIESPDFTIKLYNDYVSGTAGGTLITYHSIDGVNYESTGDTITISSLGADALDSEVISLTDFNYPYLKLTYAQTGTAVTVPKGFIYAKFN